MDINDVVVGRFVVANHTVGSDNPLDEWFFGESVLEVGKHYKVLEVGEAFEGDTEPMLIELADNVGQDLTGWWCHPKYFTALEGSL